MNNRQLLKGISCCIGMLLLILDSKTALEGAQQGLEICAGTIIPGLFPFFLLSILLCSTLTGSDILLLRPLGRLCGIPAGCESVLIPSLLGGYPSGAQCISQSYRQGSISRSDAARLLFFCNQSGPSFIFGIVGSVFAEKRLVWLLWAIQISSAFLCAAVIYEVPKKGAHIQSAEITLTEAIPQSIRITASVCAWVILFRTVTVYLDRWLFWLLPESIKVMFTGFLELTNGCCLLNNISRLPVRFVLCSVMLSFGGICVLMQTASVIGDLPLKAYMEGKLLQTVFSFLLSIAVTAFSPYILTAVPLLCAILKKIVAFVHAMMYNDSINLRRNSYAFSKKNGTRLQLLSEGHPAERGSYPVFQKRPAEPG